MTGIMPRFATILLTLICLDATAAADPAHGGSAKPVAEKPPGTVRSTLPIDPLSGIEGSPDSWSVSRDDTGCYLLSPFRKTTSRLAIGRHPRHGLGVFGIRLALALAGESAVEPVQLHIGGQDMARPGRTIGANLLLVSVTEEDIAAAMAELRSNGTLWVRMRQSWISHSGREVNPALAQFTEQCGFGSPG